jgi:hypothetical protein
MRSWPFFSWTVSIGVLVLLVQVGCIVRALRHVRADPIPRSRTWPAVLSSAVALILPALVTVLVEGGRGMLITDVVAMLGPRSEFALMRTEWNQQRMLFVGASLGFPSFLLAGITVGMAIWWKAKNIHRILLSSLAPAALMPFFVGVWLYLYRLGHIEYPGLTGSAESTTAPILARALDAAKLALDAGAWASCFAVMVLFVLQAGRVLRADDATELARPSIRGSLAATVGMVAAATSLWWLSRSLAAENRTPFPPHDQRFTQRIYPVVPAGLSQGDLYEFGLKTERGYHAIPLSFPLTWQQQDALVVWGPVIGLSGNGITVNGISVVHHELQDRLVREISNDRLLHPLGRDEGDRSPLIEAPPNLPLHLLAEVLTTAYEIGLREVRLVTGLPETVQRPTLGALTRINYQTTKVVLSGLDDSPAANQARGIRIHGEPERYRDLLDRLFELEKVSSEPVVMLVGPGDQRRRTRGVIEIPSSTPNAAPLPTTNAPSARSRQHQ